MFVKKYQRLLIKIVLETLNPLYIEVIIYLPGCKLIFKLATPFKSVILV